MKIYYDFQILTDQKYGGISRYFFELYSRISNFDDRGEGGGIDVKISCIHSYNYYFREQIKMHPIPKNRIIRGLQRRFFRIPNMIKAVYEMRGRDIIHPTYFRPYMLGHYSGKLILTAHDAIHEKFNGNKKVAKGNRLGYHAADHIIAVSENTKRDILELYPDISPDKISVIYHGSSMKEAAPDKSKNPLGRRYVLFVGYRGWYKNFLRFVRAMRPILERDNDLCVLCVGGGAFTVEELEAIGDMSSRYVQRNLDDDSLAQAYANAECFVFPSEYEGFGIPILEAFACNCPVLSSNSSSLPEVAGDAAEYFSPLDADGMSAKILRVIEDDSLREKMRLAGRERLKFFDWDKTARETLECYRKVLEG